LRKRTVLNIYTHGWTDLPRFVLVAVGILLLAIGRRLKIHRFKSSRCHLVLSLFARLMNPQKINQLSGVNFVIVVRQVFLLTYILTSGCLQIIFLFQLDCPVVKCALIGSGCFTGRNRNPVIHLRYVIRG
jgi:hypothetical protein